MSRIDPFAVRVQAIKSAVVVVGLWDGKTRKVVRVGSGFIADKKRGLIVTAAHTLINIWGDRNFTYGENYYGLARGKVVVGVIPNDEEDGLNTAIFRYFAKIVAKDRHLRDNECHVDACVLQISTRMENDVGGDGRHPGGAGFEHDQRLGFGKAGQRQRVQGAQIIVELDRTGEDDGLFQPQMPDERPAFPRIGRVFFPNPGLEGVSPFRALKALSWLTRVPKY